MLSYLPQVTVPLETRVSTMQIRPRHPDPDDSFQLRLQGALGVVTVTTHSFTIFPGKS